MRIVFDEIENYPFNSFKGGEGVTDSRMFYDGKSRIMQASIRLGSSIGVHTHENNCEVMFFISGSGTVVCDGVEEPVGPGVCHYCPRGSTHSVTNTGDTDLVMYATVTELDQ